MLSLTEIKTQIENAIGEPFDTIGIAANYETVIANGIQGEINIYVIPGNDDGARLESTGVVISEVSAPVGILLGIREVTDAIGEAATDPLKTYREALAGALHGFRPTGANEALAFSNGGLVDFKDGVYWQLDNYESSYNLRGT